MPIKSSLNITPYTVIVIIAIEIPKIQNILFLLKHNP